MKKNLGLIQYLCLIILLFSSIQCSRKIAVREGTGFNSDGKELFDEITGSSLPWSIWAKSVEGRNIPIIEVGNGDNVYLIMGGFHGSERLGTRLVYKFAQILYEGREYPLNIKVVILPVINPDGLVYGTRFNKNGVDINRNFPTNNWQVGGAEPNERSQLAASEPETKAVMRLLDKYKPKRILSVHTPLKVANYDGPAQGLAEAMSKLNGYPANEYIGYPTPGSFGTYAGKERDIPVITFELPNEEFNEIWNVNIEALKTFLNY